MAMSKSLALEDDEDVLAFVIQENTASNALFQKTGYEIVGNCSWLGSKPKPTS
jgi:L-amino acid N-acyltransferase YncA